MECQPPESPLAPAEATAVVAAWIRPPRVWPVFVALVGVHLGMAILGALAFVGYIIVTLVRDPRLRTDPQQLMGVLHTTLNSPWFLIASVTLSAAGFGGTALIGARLSSEGVRARLRIGPSNLSPGRFFVAVAGFFALGEVGSALVAWAHLPISGSLARLSRALASTSGASLAGAVLSIGLFAGLGEELLFRGFMQVRLRQRWGAWPAILISAAAFGIAHFNPLHSALAFTMGLYAGWVLERVGSIRPGMAGHVVNNALCVLFASAFPGGAEVRFGAGRCLAVSVVVLVACVVALNRDPAAKVAPLPHAPGTS